MELSHSQEGSVSVVALRGRFDQASADSVHQALLPYINECRSDGKPLLLDFSDVAYISSVGLRVLIMAAKQVIYQHLVQNFMNALFLFQLISTKE